LKLEDIEALDEGRDGGVSELEYIKFMLVAMKKIDGELFDDLRDQFDRLDLTGDGQITRKDLTILATRKMKKVTHKLRLTEYKVKFFAVIPSQGLCNIKKCSRHLCIVFPSIFQKQKNTTNCSISWSD